jgi:hypothetical protein
MENHLNTPKKTEKKNYLFRNLVMFMSDDVR